MLPFKLRLRLREDKRTITKKNPLKKETRALPEDVKECVQLKYMEHISHRKYRCPNTRPEFSREPVANIIKILDPPAVHGSATRQTFVFHATVEECSVGEL